jgi:signal transduction histidine kinase
VILSINKKEIPLLYSFLAFIFCVLITTTILYILYLSSIVKEFLEHKMESNSALLERILLDKLGNSIKTIYNVSKHIKVYNANSDIVSALVDYTAEHSLNFAVPFASIFFADDENSLVVVSREGVIKNNFTIVHSDYLSQTRSSPGTVKIGRSILDFNSGKQAIPLAIGIEGYNRKYLGTLVAMIDLMALQKFVLNELDKIGLAGCEFAVFVNNSNLVFGTGSYGQAKYERYSNANNLKISEQERIADCDQPQLVSKFSFFDHHSKHELCYKVNEYNLNILSMYSYNATLKILGHFILSKTIFALLMLMLLTSLFSWMLYSRIIQGLQSCMQTLISLYKYDKARPKQSNIIEVSEVIKGTLIAGHFVKSLTRKLEQLTLYNRDLEMFKEYACFAIERERNARYENISEFDNALVLGQLEKDRRMLTEQKLIQAESINRTNSIFVSNIGHELRTPLSAIIGFSEMLLCMNSLEGRPKEYIKDIYSSAQHLLAIVEDILDASRVISGNVLLCEAEVDLESLLAYCLRCLSSLYLMRDIKIRADVSIAKILVDEKRFKQIILNLLSNALKFTNSSVDIYTILVDKSLLIVIEDDGVGIAEEDATKVLGVFARAESRLRREGLGLGLPLVKRLVELHQGELSIMSAPDKGTKVTITLSIDRVR